MKSKEVESWWISHVPKYQVLGTVAKSQQYRVASSLCAPYLERNSLKDT